MRIGLAQTRFPQSSSNGVEIVKDMIKKAQLHECDMICFPESIIPGMRGVGFEVEEYDHKVVKAALEEVCDFAKQSTMAVILPMEWKDELGYHLVAFVINKNGEVLDYQIKNQIDPTEDDFGFVPGDRRHLFEINNVKFGIVICHEGWRYPETVRWAAVRGASIVFHPQVTINVDNPEFYDNAMICRSMENNIYFASVNYALENQESTSALISPTGERLIEGRKNNEELLVYDIDPDQATRLLAKRFKPELLKDSF
ncbi:carbon-nitrogen hydrolase family protein [Chengkuizengella axinellae]|uniref:Carbon-nitrogen hydrolase family protein n=1 Tax=Chengkuizengella axinellae TaxID=3064388 RepID=A0ABT9IX61_9BACL|nr:carbon-nitrogen hydrolase family protein [Chengkuizengella sp. 2205SS18-9]MDP5273953.1 carbon-nitrogen hydrolase family protein [Chengkuizengella sp. 2205SS18-9]